MTPRKALAVLLMLLLASTATGQVQRTPQDKSRKVTFTVGCGGDVALDSIFVRDARFVSIRLRTAASTACSTFTVQWSTNDSAWTSIPSSGGFISVSDSISNTICNSSAGRLGWATVYTRDTGNGANLWFPVPHMRMLLKRKFGAAAVDTNTTKLDTVYVDTRVLY